MTKRHLAEAQARLAAWDEAWKYDTGLGLRHKDCQAFIAHAPEDLRDALATERRCRDILVRLNAAGAHSPEQNWVVRELRAALDGTA